MNMLTCGIWFATITLPRLGHPATGVIIPGVTLILSIVLTVWLYRYFTKGH